MFIYLQMIETAEDKGKFEILYTEYRGLMFHIADSILHNKHDAEDAVHNAFVKIAEHIIKIGDPLCPKTKAYIITILESKAIDIYRHKQRHSEVPFDEESVGIQFNYTGDNALATCIAQLPPRYREVLALKYRHGCNNRETAKILSITEANAIKLDQRAKAKLRELCFEEGVL